MPKRFRLNWWFNAAMTDDGYNRLRKFTRATGLDEGKMLPFLFAKFDGMINQRHIWANASTFQFKAEGLQALGRRVSCPVG